jgi:hypothetical protein
MEIILANTQTALCILTDMVSRATGRQIAGEENQIKQKTFIQVHIFGYASCNYPNINFLSFKALG